MSCRISRERIEATIAFHGHSCPGLAIGIRAAELALRELDNPGDSDIVAVVETDMCGVDAIQFLTGATMGKGNLVHLDHGKMAFSFFRRQTGRGFRALLRPEARGGADGEMDALMRRVADGAAAPEDTGRLEELREDMRRRYMELPLEQMFEVSALERGAPRPAKILQSLVCAHCGEAVMESRTRRFAGQTLCIPCFGRVEQKV